MSLSPIPDPTPRFRAAPPHSGEELRSMEFRYHIKSRFFMVLFVKSQQKETGHYSLPLHVEREIRRVRSKYLNKKSGYKNKKSSSLVGG